MRGVSGFFTYRNSVFRVFFTLEALKERTFSTRAPEKDFAVGAGAEARAAGGVRGRAPSNDEEKTTARRTLAKAACFVLSTFQLHQLNRSSAVLPPNRTQPPVPPRARVPPECCADASSRTRAHPLQKPATYPPKRNAPPSPSRQWIGAQVFLRARIGACSRGRVRGKGKGRSVRRLLLLPSSTRLSGGYASPISSNHAGAALDGRAVAPCRAARGRGPTAARLAPPAAAPAGRGVGGARFAAAAAAASNSNGSSNRRRRWRR